jgi:hypothetical protein
MKLVYEVNSSSRTSVGGEVSGGRIFRVEIGTPVSCTCMTPTLLHLPCSHVITACHVQHVLYKGSNYNGGTCCKIVNNKFNTAHKSLNILYSTAQHNRLFYTSVPLYRLVHDHMRDCHTSKTAATKSCSLLAHSSYMGHHSNTLAPHPLALDEIQA